MEHDSLVAHASIACLQLAETEIATAERWCRHLKVYVWGEQSGLCQRLMGKVTANDRHRARLPPRKNAVTGYERDNCAMHLDAAVVKSSSH